MNKDTGIISLLIAIVLLIPSKLLSQEEIQRFAGSWQGELDVQGTKLIIEADFSINESFELEGVLHSPMQGAKNIPVNSIQLSGDSIIFTVSVLAVEVKGAMLQGDSVIECAFEQGPFSLPLRLVKAEDPFTFERPQEPKPPFPYIEEEVVFVNKKADGIRLAGTLTLPDNKVVSPAVVLITGSGAQNRDEEIMGHKPFLVIADYLTRNGIAVLRFDDRGFGESEGDFASSTSADFATDVEAAIQFLRSHNNVDSSLIGLIGHSEGGMIASIVASSDATIAFVVMLAGPGISGEEVLLSQIKKIQKVEGQKRKIARRVLKDSRESFRILKKYDDKEKAAKVLTQYFDKRSARIPEKLQPLYGYDERSVEAKIAAYNKDWFRYFLTFEPEDYLKDIDIPLLALFGGKDVQVISKDNARAVNRIARKYNKDNFLVKTYANRNHLFQEAKTGSISEYAQISETIGEEVLKDITEFIINIVNKN